jgi:hypothetical protein
MLAVCATVGIPTHFRYAPRRVQCAEHGVVVEQIPWSEGKRPVTRAMMGFLARWARRLSWRETAQVFQTSWEAVYRSVEWFVQWGLAQRQLQQVWSVGIDEIHWGTRQAAAIDGYACDASGTDRSSLRAAFCLALPTRRRMARAPNSSVTTASTAASRSGDP